MNKIILGIGIFASLTLATLNPYFVILGVLVCLVNYKFGLSDAIYSAVFLIVNATLCFAMAIILTEMYPYEGFFNYSWAASFIEDIREEGLGFIGEWSQSVLSVFWLEWETIVEGWNIQGNSFSRWLQLQPVIMLIWWSMFGWGILPRKRKAGSDKTEDKGSISSPVINYNIYQTPPDEELLTLSPEPEPEPRNKGNIIDVSSKINKKKEEEQKKNIEEKIRNEIEQERKKEKGLSDRVVKKISKKEARDTQKENTQKAKEFIIKAKEAIGKVKELTKNIKLPFKGKSKLFKKAQKPTSEVQEDTIKTQDTPDIREQDTIKVSFIMPTVGKELENFVNSLSKEALKQYKYDTTRSEQWMQDSDVFKCEVKHIEYSFDTAAIWVKDEAPDIDVLIAYEKTQCSGDKNSNPQLQLVNRVKEIRDNLPEKTKIVFLLEDGPSSTMLASELVGINVFDLYFIKEGESITPGHIIPWIYNKKKKYQDVKNYRIVK